MRLVVPDLGFGDAYFSLSAEGRDLAGGDQNAGPAVRGPRPPLSLEVAARPKSIGNGIPRHRALDAQGQRAPAGATRQPDVHAHDQVAPRGQA